MPDLNELLVFARVVEHGSFVAAARLLGLPKTTVSRKVQALERRLGARLLQRSTRRVVPTEAGLVLHAHCARIADEIVAAEAAVGHLHDAPRGLLKVSAPFVFGTAFLAPVLPRFLERCPDVRIAIVLDEVGGEPLGREVDVAIRAGELPDSRVAFRPLGNFTRTLFAAPDYLLRRGRPEVPADLAGHEALVLGSEQRDGRSEWLLTDGTRRERVVVKSVLGANDPSFLVHAALAGRGIAKLPHALCHEHVAAGRLQRVLPGWSGPPVPLSALYPSRDGLAPKVRAFLDFLVDKVASAADGETRRSRGVQPG
jgi:LysR family transcriptional regulator for bpeEF and oprC